VISADVSSANAGISSMLNIRRSHDRTSCLTKLGRGGEGVGHETKQGKPIAAGKDLGEGVGKGGKKVGKGVKKAVSAHSDSSDPEKKQ